MLFGGVNELGDQLTNAYVFTIEQEDRSIHKLTESKTTLDKGDAFPYNGSFIRNGEDSTILGTQSVWNISSKDLTLTRVMGIEAP